MVGIRAPIGAVSEPDMRLVCWSPTGERLISELSMWQKR